MGNTFLFGRSVFSPSIYIAPLIVHTEQRLFQCEELLGRGKRERQTYRKTDRQTETQRERKTDRETETDRHIQADERTDTQTYTQKLPERHPKKQRERAIDRHRVTGTDEEPEEKTERDGERDRERQRHREGRFLFFVDSSNQQECRPSITGSEVVVKCT